MAEVRAFAGIRYARELGPRLAPPYDVLDGAARAELAREPENLVQLTLPLDAAGAPDYAGAGARLRAWLGSGVLVRDRQPGLYAVEERLTGGRVRRGLLAAVRLADYAERQILPHERTLAGPKEDRLRLTREVRANLEPLFFLYEDREQALAASLEKGRAAEPLARARTADGEVSLGALRDPAGIAAVQGFLAARPLLIADGHHRYETMLKYRDEQRAAGGARGEAAHEFVLAYLVNAFDPGSQIRAIHRVLGGAPADARAVLRAAGFELAPLAAAAAAPAAPAQSAERALAALAERAPAAHSFALVWPDGAAELATRRRGAPLDVEVLHEELLPRLGGELSFDAQPERVIASVRARRAALGILMHPLATEDFFRVVQAGRVLPQKSTFFSPKLPGGLVLRAFDE